jgi:hypothetical protein
VNAESIRFMAKMPHLECTQLGVHYMVILKILFILFLIIIPGGIPVLITMYWRNRNVNKTERDEDRGWQDRAISLNSYDIDSQP